MVKPIIDQPITTRGDSTPTTPEVSQSRWGIIRALDRGMETFRAAGPLKRTGMIGLAIVGLAAATLLSPLLGIAVGGAALGYGAARFTKGFVGSKDLATRVESSVDKSLGRTRSEENLAGVSASLRPQATNMERVKTLEAQQRRLEAQGVLEETGHHVDSRSIETLRNNKEIYAENQRELEFLHTELDQEDIAREREEWDSKNLSAASPSQSATRPVASERVYKEEVSSTLSNQPYNHESTLEDQQKGIKEEINRLNKHQERLEKSGLLGLNDLEKEPNFENNPLYQDSRNAKAIFEENKHELAKLNNDLLSVEEQLNWKGFVEEWGSDNDAPPAYETLINPFVQMHADYNKRLSNIEADLRNVNNNPVTQKYLLENKAIMEEKMSVLALYNKPPREITTVIQILERQLREVQERINVNKLSDPSLELQSSLIGLHNEEKHLNELISLAKKLRNSAAN